MVFTTISNQDCGEEKTTFGHGSYKTHFHAYLFGTWSLIGLPYDLDHGLQ